MRHPILLFDGECNFCRASVRWLIERDPEGVIRYAPLESEVGERLLRQHGAPPDQVNSVVLLYAGRAYYRSNAVFEALRHLPNRWRFARALRVVPRPLRDLGYEAISRNRSWISHAVGTINDRYEPTGAVRERFLTI